MGPYIFKWGQETIWLIVVAALAALGALLSGIPADQFFADPKAVFVLALAAVGRPVGAIVFNQVQKLIDRFTSQ